MSLRVQAFQTRVTVPVTVYEFTCDAKGCTRFADLMVNDELARLVRVNDDDVSYDCILIADRSQALSVLESDYDWQERDGQVYCPLHAWKEA